MDVVVEASTSESLDNEVAPEDVPVTDAVLEAVVEVVLPVDEKEPVSEETENDSAVAMEEVVPAEVISIEPSIAPAALSSDDIEVMAVEDETTEVAKSEVVLESTRYRHLFLRFLLLSRPRNRVLQMVGESLLKSLSHLMSQKWQCRNLWRKRRRRTKRRRVLMEKLCQRKSLRSKSQRMMLTVSNLRLLLLLLHQNHRNLKR
ncbi:hypothetical protein BCR33DRAFT_114648 [Rhizoclosmatium globosum]|uniref:Uncharacterized protein n=1 Tax=Rhizoclosmatium globosum TaxID=329046 RepID=A0A1Y2CIZ2_9FUNG|nr:hypothetical protein BCR33DRAFT_114648 [Rhizoclosmatium globosum]|eukprot:ORY46989.1 hypothetical protein BCR33DRAFT_114648 [Rhizoclosmatium globosum]